MSFNLAKMYSKILCCLFVFILFYNNSNAQNDTHHTMYMFNKLAYNPAYAGSKETMVFTGHYRNQWAGIKGAPQTFTFTSHTPFFKRKCGIGLSVIADKIGMVNTLYFDLAYNYKFKLSKKTTLSIGLDGQLDYGRIDWTEVDPFDPLDEGLSNSIKTRLNPNFGFGLYLQNQNYYLGASVPKILKTSIYERETTKDVGFRSLRSYYLMGGFSKRLTNKIELEPGAMISLSPNAPFELDMNLNLIFLKRLLVGVSYRLEDSVDAIVQFKITPQLKLAIACDVTLSELGAYSPGSFEVMIEYALSSDELNINNPRFF